MKNQFMTVAVLVFLPFALLAQTSPSMQNNLPPGAIDGSKNPELIPDIVALRLVFSGLRIPAGGDSKTVINATAKQARRFKRIGLSEIDKATFKNILVRFDSELATWEENTSAALAGGLTISTSPDIERDAIVQRTRDQLEQQLTPAGFNNFIQYVTEAKQNMIVWQ